MLRKIIARATVAIAAVIVALFVTAVVLLKYYDAQYAAAVAPADIFGYDAWEHLPEDVAGFLKLLTQNSPDFGKQSINTEALFPSAFSSREAFLIGVALNLSGDTALADKFLAHAAANLNWESPFWDRVPAELLQNCSDLHAHWITMLGWRKGHDIVTYYMREGKIRTAMERAKRDSVRGSFFAQTLLGETAFNLRQYDLAVYYLTEASKYNHLALRTLASALLELEQNREAEAVLKEAIALGESNAYYRLGMLYVEEERFEEATAILKGDFIDNESDDAWFLSIWIPNERDKTPYEETVAALDNHQGDRYSHLYTLTRGDLALAHERYDDAIAAYSRVLLRSPYFLYSRLRLIQALKKSGKIEEAQAVLTESLELFYLPSEKDELTDMFQK